MKIFFPLLISLAMGSPLDYLDNYEAFTTEEPAQTPSRSTIRDYEPYPSPYESSSPNVYANPFVTTLPETLTEKSQELYENYYSKPDTDGILKYYLKQAQ